MKVTLRVDAVAGAAGVVSKTPGSVPGAHPQLPGDVGSREPLVDPLDRRLIPWLDAVSELVRSPCGDFPHRPLMCLLGETFGEAVGWNSLGPDGEFVVEFHGTPAGWPGPELLTAWREHVHDHPLVQWQLRTAPVRGDDARAGARRMVTERGRAGGRRVPGAVRPRGAAGDPLRTPRRHLRAFVLSRSGSDFPDEDLALARRLQPLLALVAHQSDVLSRRGWHPADCAGLTGRELATLQLLDDGLTAGAIGHRLGISPRTVHKHLENVYRKLGVRDRLLASRVAHEAGLLEPVSEPGDPAAPPR